MPEETIETTEEVAAVNDDKVMFAESPIGAGITEDSAVQDPGESAATSAEPAEVVTVSETSAEAVAETEVEVLPRPVQFGDEGEHVTGIQTMLNGWGKLHADFITGKFEVATEAAVMAFQDGQQYQPTGVVDDSTLNALRGERDRAVEEPAIAE
jgi:peptidoglycan hydrolase-like protein with peptidoglycan-binding domain